MVGIIITAGGGPNHETIGFRFWNETGGFVQYSGIEGAKGRFLGFFSGECYPHQSASFLTIVQVLISAAFAFIGTEITAIAAAETANVSHYLSPTQERLLSVSRSHENKFLEQSRVSGSDSFSVSWKSIMLQVETDVRQFIFAVPSWYGPLTPLETFHTDISRLEFWSPQLIHLSTSPQLRPKVHLSLPSRYLLWPHLEKQSNNSQNAGISVLPSIINAALLTSAWSAGCADLYVSSRTLYGLYSRGQAPKIFGKTRSDGLPWVCVLFCAVFSLLSFMAAAHGKAGTVFGYCKLSWPSCGSLTCDMLNFQLVVSNMTAICGMISWSCILWTNIRWHKGLKVKGIDRSTLPYRAPLQPYLSYCWSHVPAYECC